MKRRFLFILLAMATVWGMTCTAASARAAQSAKAGPITSGAKDQKSIALTIYNVDLGLVKDRRRITLRQGTGELRFTDVATGIIPTSVHIKSMRDSRSLQILEQNYEYDLLNPQKLLDKYVGKQVKLYTKNPYRNKEKIVTATLLSNNGSPIYKIGNEITFGHPGRVIFPGVPDNLISKPTLVWLLTNRLSTYQEIEASYLTSGITWQSDYVVTLNDRDDGADLSGWVTIDNKSGATYNNARLKLVAGDVNRGEEKFNFRKQLMDRGAVAKEAAPQFKEQDFFEYHIYTLQRQATVKNNQTKQIQLVQAGDIPVRKEFIYQGAPHYYYSRYGVIAQNQKVGVFVEIQNKKNNNLGMPLPKGTVRVYKHDKDGSLQFVGEDSIDHTPKDEKIRLKLGEAFDIVGGRKMTNWKVLRSNRYEASYEISLRNHKKEEVVVKVVEPIPGDWKMLSASHKHKKTNASIAEFLVSVPKDKEVKLTYRVRMKF
ncbi:MAG TPA: DUF4139 domain-containing protein [Nitrospiraceae bacterium]|nr:DUF4139 domain-containing protein [Nitrospiraceae bacterium]